MNDKQKARIALARGGSIKGIAERYKISVNTLKSWRKGKAQKKEVLPRVIPKAEWMQCYLHDNAHLVKKNGEAVCSTAAKPVSGIIGRNWHPWDGVTKCTRCMGWESKIKKD